MRSPRALSLPPPNGAPAGRTSFLVRSPLRVDAVPGARGEYRITCRAESGDGWDRDGVFAVLALWPAQDDVFALLSAMVDAFNAQRAPGDVRLSTTGDQAGLWGGEP